MRRPAKKINKGLLGAIGASGNRCSCRSGSSIFSKKENRDKVKSKVNYAVSKGKVEVAKAKKRVATAKKKLLRK